ncbi:HK97 gp10 family phage protein [Clostridium tertium]|uniref:HK97-gp10 family putative phage morphogenesis protein n=1 Tax=Clostridium tertium TaxID=1559 RepID=UPI00115B12EA|nr:HK97-gp10 family putative phage morphogenesis protein [Clostridium tertium]MDB1935139.1 HK97 gp10 family phage protein [Clostridium tertium]MDB1938406.1 HK97 gp10 family phage protein [Clostridium tertium]MDB1956024.1 HK97 gp10 family phage protein [Clostridium tertium]MDB1959019.1 HK97 gp10 family phage protein [Clostridium tertium]MDB1962096.1 HK97 gp10 family phage protein [Clostridium tertium]
MIIKFEGLDELIKEVEKVSRESEIEKANAKILRKCAKKSKETAKTKMPKSNDPMLSGRKGSRTGKHSADNIPLSGVKKENGYQSITVGWDKSDNSPYFYTKFTEWGTSKIKPIAYMENTRQELTKYFSEVAQSEYENLISKLK